MKRAYCLYRVSTLGQVEKDDIPMQREAAVVRMVFDLYCSGKMGTYQIAQYLSKQGIPARSGN